MVPARAPRASRAAASATSTSGATRRTRYTRRADHLQGLRDLELDLGPGRQAPTTGTASTRTSPTSTSTTRRCSEAMFAVARLLARAWASTACGSTPCPTCTSARARTARTCPRRTRSCSELRAHVDEQVRRPHAAGRGQPVAGGRRRLLRRRRRVPHGVPLPAHAAAVHGAAAWRTASRSSTSSTQTPAIPETLPVGAVPAQPRRADARDGDRRGARLHVPRLRRTTRRRASTSASAAGWRRCSATTAAASS